MGDLTLGVETVMIKSYVMKLLVDSVLALACADLLPRIISTKY